MTNRDVIRDLSELEGLEARVPHTFETRIFTQDAPEATFPEDGMHPDAAYRLIDRVIALDGDPNRNLATFVTTWMEPQAERLITENLHRNFIDHAEYPRSAEIEQRVIGMLADLFHAPAGKPMGARTQGSSEAIMLGALAMKWRWRAARGDVAGTPNLVFGGDVHVVWEKFCRYFDVEPRTIPLQPGKYTIGPDDVEPLLDENTIGVVAVIGTTFTGQNDDIVGIDSLLRKVNDSKGWDISVHADAASGGFTMPFIYPDDPWDFRLETVRSINVSGHKFGLVYPGVGWLIFREEKDLPEDLVFYENYLGKRDATFTLNFSTGSSMVLAQYYNLVRLGRAGYELATRSMQLNAQHLAEGIAATDEFEVVPEPRLPLVAFTVAEGQDFNAFEVAEQLAQLRGWMVPAYTMPPDAESVEMLRVLVKLNQPRDAADLLLEDLMTGVETLKKRGGGERPKPKRVHQGTGY
ncbi:MAG: glutamate decarboxylase [Solirubrobacterales bacterium]